MDNFTAFELVSFTAHSAYPCQAASIGFGSEHMATMTSSSANRLLVADLQQQVAATRRSSMSLLLTAPLAGARELVVGKDGGWLRGPTIEIQRKRFLDCLVMAQRATSATNDRAAIDRLRKAFVEGLPEPEVSALDNEAFEDAVADAYGQPGTSPSGNRTPQQVRTTSYQFVRDPAVVAFALQVAKGVCGDCEKPAPFDSKRTGLPYLEVHHKKTLAAGGEDTIDNVIALCPNCHRKRHHGAADA
jgi:5-methylcytosine-specific restriction endonuclease McrA